jgi:hypothetical protein
MFCFFLNSNAHTHTHIKAVIVLVDGRFELTKKKFKKESKKHSAYFKKPQRLPIFVFW